MTDTKITLMAFEPKSSISTKVYTVGMPPKLSDALFGLLPPPKEGQCLGTNRLKEGLRCWLDQAVQLNALYAGKTCRDWLVALKPINLARLCNVIANWVDSSCKRDARGTSAYEAVMALLKPETFEEYVCARDLCLFDEERRPSKAVENLVFPAFSSQVANAVVGKHCLISGVDLVFSRLSQGTSSDYELVSNVLWYEESPYSVVLRFHVETLPVSRKAHLNVDVSVRRFIRGVWQEKPYLTKRVHAYVRTDSGTLRVVPYGYDRNKGRLDWDELSRKNYEAFELKQLPDLVEYLSNVSTYAREGHKPQILSPCSAFTVWAESSQVKSGVSVMDKAAFHAFLTDQLGDYVEPVQPLTSVRLTSLKTVFDDASKKMWEDLPEEAESQHEEWARGNRMRLAKCTGESAITFQLVGTRADTVAMQFARQEIVYFLGAEGDHEGLKVAIQDSFQDELLAPLTSPGDEESMLRWRKIERSLGKANGLTACIVVLPGAGAYEDKAGKTASVDPKTAIRMGLARTGRLSQFLMPHDMGDNIEHRARAAVRDLMRQLGFMPEFKAVRGGVDLHLPVLGLRIYRAPWGKAVSEFPLMVGVEADSGRIFSECPLFSGKRLPYWKAQLELAAISTSEGYLDKVERISGRDLQRILDDAKREAVSETLLLVQAYGCIRYPVWWPGLSDAGLVRSRLYYGPASGEVLFELDGSKLAIVRVRSGAHGEVPDYFTEAKPLADDEYGERPTHYCKQGIFPMDGYVLALTERPNVKSYTTSFCSSKFDHPEWLFAEKTLNEYCLLTSGDEGKAIEYAKYAEALRGNMIQLVKSDMKVNLPAPLHLAEKMEEYVWAPAKRKSVC